MTRDIWYYNVSKREGYKSFNKTNPIKFENLEPVLKWAENKKNDSKSWKKNIEEIKKLNYNLDVKHPDAAKMEEMPSPDKLIDDLVKQQKQISDLLKIVKEKMT